MTLLKAFDPPAFLDDFNGIPGQRQAWSDFVSESFDASIAGRQEIVTSKKGAAPGVVQFYNPTEYDPGATLVEQEITWNAFPKELLRQFGRERALAVGDTLWPLSAYSATDYDPDVAAPRAPDEGYYRPQVEYCEWRVSRDPRTNAITRVTFTSEPPEYWMALFGGALPGSKIVFPGSRERLVALYRELVDPAVTLEDITTEQPAADARKGAATVTAYNPYNKWNTTHGIAHLAAPPNALTAEIELGADATVLYHDGAGRPLTQADALICGAGYGGPNRNSDPTIGSSVNALARLGAMITLPNPVGLYMDHIDTSGWELPGGIAARDCVRVVRGSARMIERLVVEVPAETGWALDALTIGGVPLRYGGQIAECITVKLVGGAALVNVTGNDLLRAGARAFLSKEAPTEIAGPVAADAPIPPGFVAAFSQYGKSGTPSSAIRSPMKAPPGPALVSRHRIPSVRHRRGL